MAKLTTAEKAQQGEAVKTLVIGLLGEGYTYEDGGGTETRNADGYRDLETITYVSRDRKSKVTIMIYGDDLLNPQAGKVQRSAVPMF